jgi:hypothetical protein
MTKLIHGNESDSVIHAFLLAVFKSPNQGACDGLDIWFQWEKQVVHIELWWENVMVCDHFEGKLMLKLISTESICVT